jgi:hypothetical protein
MDCSKADIIRPTSLICASNRFVSAEFNIPGISANST